MPTQTTGRNRGAATNAARFGRTQTPQAKSFGRGQTPQANRFGRSAQQPKPTSGRRSSATSTGRTLPLVTRKQQPKKSGAAGLIGQLTKALPTGAAAKTAKKGGGKPAGFALAAAAAGMAFKNRDKLAGMVGRKQEATTTTTTTEPVLVDPIVSPGQQNTTPPAI